MSTTVVDAAFRSRLTQVIQSLDQWLPWRCGRGVGQPIYKWLAGRGQPSVANLVALARAGRVSVEWLATGTETTRAHRRRRMRSSMRFIFMPRNRIRFSSGRDGITAQRAGGGFDRVSRGVGQASAPHGVARLDSDRGRWRFDGADGRGFGFDPRHLAEPRFGRTELFIAA